LCAGNCPALDNTGIVYILESPDMRPAPVSLRQGRRATAPTIRASDIVRNPDAYDVLTLDGRAGRRDGRLPAGMFLAARKGDPASARLVALPTP
jgi:hypothetical protein